MASESILGSYAFHNFFLSNTAFCGHNTTKFCVSKCFLGSCHHPSHASSCLTFALPHVCSWLLCVVLSCFVLCRAYPCAVSISPLSLSSLSSHSTLLLSLLYLLSLFFLFSRSPTSSLSIFFCLFSLLSYPSTLSALISSLSCLSSRFTLSRLS